MVTPIGVAHSGSPYGLHLCTLWAVTHIVTHIHGRSAHMVAAHKGNPKRQSAVFGLTNISENSNAFTDLQNVFTFEASK